jgi:hypothetical protein
MDLKTLLIALDLLEIGLAAGASTFALTFYFMGIKDEVIDASERRFMGAVYFVLRVAIVVIVVTELFYILYWGFDAFTLVKTMEVLWFRWMLLGIIVANALLMVRPLLCNYLAGPCVAVRDTFVVLRDFRGRDDRVLTAGEVSVSKEINGPTFFPYSRTYCGYRTWCWGRNVC